jgi:hypothetical protein
MENRKVKQVQREGRGYKERVLEGECSANIMYSCMKMEK